MHTATPSCSAAPAASCGGHAPQARCSEPAPALDAEQCQRASIELLRQAAQAAGLLDAADRTGADGVPSQRACDAIERLLERELSVPEPDDEACRRFHAAHAGAFTRGERLRLRHLLLAVTPGAPLAALRDRAEQLLLELRCASTPAAFAERAAECSNCPSGAQGGELGWLHAGDCAPEFAREVFGRTEVGVLPRLVQSRFGFHVVEVLEREPGQLRPYDEVQGAVRQALQQQGWSIALRQYLEQLAAATPH